MYSTVVLAESVAVRIEKSFSTKWPEIPRDRNYPDLPYVITVSAKHTKQTGCNILAMHSIHIIDRNLLLRIPTYTQWPSGLIIDVSFTWVLTLTQVLVHVHVICMSDFIKETDFPLPSIQLTTDLCGFLYTMHAERYIETHLPSIHWNWAELYTNVQAIHFSIIDYSSRNVYVMTTSFLHNMMKVISF